MNMKQLLIDKGEKVGLLVAGGFALLLVGLGAMTYMSNAFDPEAKKSELARKTSDIQRRIADPNATPDPLEKQYENKFEFDKVSAVALKSLYFDPFAQPDNKRLNPAVVKAKAIQADALNVKIPAYDIREINNKITLGVMTARKTDGKQKDVDLKGALSNLQKQRLARMKRAMGSSLPPPGQGGVGTGLGGEGGSTGGPGGGLGMPPGGGLGSGLGSGSPGGEGTGMMGMGGMGMGGGFDVKGERMDISYVDVDDEKALAGKRLALTLYTQRMVVVQAAFPYKEQLESIRQAMKVSTMAEFLRMPEAQPTFKGLNVQRREVGPDGTPGKWIDLKFEDSYRPIFMRKISDMDDDPELSFVKLHPANRLVMPLPSMLPSIATSKYPAVRLPELKSEIEKRIALNAPPPAVQQENKFKGQGDIFNPQGFDQKSMAGAFGETGEGSNPGLMPGFGGMRPPGGMMKGGLEEGSGGNLTTNARPIDPLGYVLIRIVDADPFIQPGRKYQYRFQVKMENPNYKKPDMVSLKSDAEMDTLIGDWSDPSETVTVQPEAAIYSVDATMPDPKDPKKTVPMPLKDGQGMLQLQRWQEQVRVEKFKEPFGDWLVAETVVSRGARVGGRQFVNLPLWSSDFNNFVMRELKDDRSANKGKEPRRGVFLDLTRTDLFVVDVEGGRSSFTTKNNKRIDDETTQEILIFSEENGTMQLRSSAIDRESVERKTREDAWKTWVAEVESATRRTTPAGGMGTGTGRFGEP